MVLFSLIDGKKKNIKSKAHHTDAELLSLIKNGERGAFDEIYERYWTGLYRSAYQRTRSKGGAEDIVQDLFISFWMKRESLVINSSLSAYFYAALKYKIIDYITSNISKRKYLNSLNTALMGYERDCSEALISKETEEWINIGINKLSPKVKQVFELSRKENLSIHEIALKMDVSEQTVKNQISKALKVIRGHLKHVSLYVLACFLS